MNNLLRKQTNKIRIPLRGEEVGQENILTEKLIFENCLTNGFIHASSCLFPPFIIPFVK